MFKGTTIEDLLAAVERAEERTTPETKPAMRVKMTAPRFDQYRTFIYEMQYTEPVQIGAA